MVDRSAIEDLMELHKIGMVTDEQMQRYAKEYAQYLMNPQIAADPAAQHTPGSFPMHAHTIKPQAPGAHAHTMSGHLMQPAGIAQAKVQQPYVPPREELQRILFGRLRISPGNTYPLEFLDFHYTPSKVYVFCVAENGATIIEDDPTLFPSDTLITAINLLKG